jgi:hypothetical protein
MESKIEFGRVQFMSFFRNNDKLSKLSVDDRIEVFKTVLAGSSDITKELLDNLLSDYCVRNLEVVKIK